MQHKYSPNNTCYAEHDDDDERTPKTLFRLLHSFELQRIISSKTKTQTHREQHFSCSPSSSSSRAAKAKATKAEKVFSTTTTTRRRRRNSERRSVNNEDDPLLSFAAQLEPPKVDLDLESLQEDLGAVVDEKWVRFTIRRGNRRGS